MDLKFPLLVVCAGSTAFAGTWMAMSGQVHLPGHRKIEVPAKGEPGKVLTFSNCQEVQAAGLAPLYAGRPGYSEELDPDGTGVACPPH